MKSAPLVELSRLFRNGMDQNGTYPRNTCSLDRAKDCISQHSPAQPMSLKRAVHSQPANYHQGNWIGHVAPYAARCSRVGYGARCKTIVCDYPVSRIGANNVCSRSTACLVSQRTATQPIIKRRLTAVESCEIVCLGNRFRRAQRSSSVLLLGRHRSLFPRACCA